jgi:hypothetical protein
MHSVCKLALGMAAIPLAGCASLGSSGGDAPTATAAAPPDWRAVATADDRQRIRNWREAFVTALNSARVAGHAAEIRREGALLSPDAALDNPAPPAGAYRCRVIKMGAKTSGLLDYIAYPEFACRIDDEGDVASFAKLSGSQRPVGIILDGDAQRQIFLGTLMLGDERRALDYGSDPERDMAGAIERVGESRWRLILPYPRFESIMDVIELVPDKQA